MMRFNPARGSWCGCTRMPCDAESPPETSADLLPMYTHDADGWWWGTSYAAPVTRITVYKEGVVGNVKNVYLTLPDSPV